MIGWIIWSAVVGFLAGLSVGLSIGKSESPKAKPSIPAQRMALSKLKEWDEAGVPMRPFRLRRSWKETRAQWEAEHNTKAQRNASLQEQIRKAQEGTLR